MNLPIGELSALLTSILWSITSIAFSTAVIRIGSIQVNINRLLMASVFLITTISIFGIPFHLSSIQISNLVISGIIGLVLGDTFLFKAYLHIGARLSMLLMAASPALSTLLAFLFLGEGLSLIKVLGIIITAIGIFIVLSQKQEVPNTKYKISYIGIFYGLLAALGQAGGLIFAKFAFNEGPINGMVAAFIRIISSAALLLPIGILSQKYKNPFVTYSKDKKALISTVAGSFFGPYLGITFSLIAITYAKVGIASTLMSLSPIIMLPMVHYLYKEHLTWRAISGACIAVVGAAVLFF